MMRRIMATAAYVSKGQMKPSPSCGSRGGYRKSPSLSPSPPLHHSRRFGSHGERGGNHSDSESVIMAGMRDLNLRQRDMTPIKHFNSRRTFCSNNGSRVILRSVDDVAGMLRDGKAKNIVIVAGAGISTPSGIPDFRTPGTGLYDNLQQYNIPYPEAIFDIDYFHHNPHPFFTLAKELYPSGKYRPNYIHYFARLLNDQGLLLRMYTQNIDGLERLAGVPPDKLVEAHGTFSTAFCVVCEEKYRGSEIKECIFDQKLPKCKKQGCPGIVKPNIVFFGEELPKRFYYYLKDMLQADMVLVMGTSLEVQPFAGIIDTVRWTVPRVLFNWTAVGPFKSGKRAKDFVAEGDLITSLQTFAQKAGMKEEMVDLITQCEGTFRLAASPPPSVFPPAKPEHKNHKRGSKATDPILAAMWRQNARTNLFSDSDSTDSSDFLDSDTDSSSSSGKKPANKSNSALLPNGRTPTNLKDSKLNSATTAKNRPLNDGGRILTGRPPSGKNGSGNGGNRNNGRNGSIPTRNFSLLSRRRETVKSTVPTACGAGSSPTRGDNNTSPGAGRGSWTPSSVRRCPPIDLALTSPQRSQRPPGSHAVKPRSSSVNKAAPEKVHSTKVGGFRSVINRARSAKPPRLVYQHKSQNSKPTYDARILAFNAFNSSSSDDEERNVDEDSSSDDSR